MNTFPLFLHVQNKPLVVFGGGRDAAAKLRLLLKTSGDIHVVASDFNTEEMHEAGHAQPHQLTRFGHLSFIRQAPLTFDLPADTVFAFAATGDPDLDRALYAKARQAGIPCCAVDQLDATDFYTPALVDRDPVTIAIGTEGTAPVLARRIKATLEQQLENTLGRLARMAQSLRPLVAANLREGRARRAFWHAFVSANPLDGCAALQLQNHQLNSTEQGDTPNARATGTEPGAKPGTKPGTAGVGKAQVSFVCLDTSKGGPLPALVQARIFEADVLIYDSELVEAYPGPSFLEIARREALLIPTSAAHSKQLLVKYAAPFAQVVRLTAQDPVGQKHSKAEQSWLETLGIPVEIVQHTNEPPYGKRSQPINLPKRQQQREAA